MLSKVCQRLKEKVIAQLMAWFGIMLYIYMLWRKCSNLVSFLFFLISKQWKESERFLPISSFILTTVWNKTTHNHSVSLDKNFFIRVCIQVLQECDSDVSRKITSSWLVLCLGGINLPLLFLKKDLQNLYHLNLVIYP